VTGACLHQRNAPGDLFPPTCVEVAGHKGDHKSKAEFWGDQKPTRITWPNDDEQASESLFDQGAA
jgi:hypothetical protein